MLDVIINNSLDLPNEKAFFERYIQINDVYEIVKQKVQNYGLFVNTTNCGEYVSKMESSLKSLKGFYIGGYKYLKETTYFRIKQGETANIAVLADYISNFVNVFAESAVFLNQFYYNMGLVLSNGTQNTFEYNNLDKLCTIAYLETANGFFEGTSSNMELLRSLKLKLQSSQLNTYVSSYEIFDELIENAISLNLTNFTKEFLLGNKVQYIQSLENEEEARQLNSFVDMVLEG